MQLTVHCWFSTLCHSTNLIGPYSHVSRGMACRVIVVCCLVPLLPCHAVLFSAVWCRLVQSRSVLCRVVSCLVVSCYLVLCCAVSSHAVSCRAVPCRTVSLCTCSSFIKHSLSTFSFYSFIFPFSCFVFILHRQKNCSVFSSLILYFVFIVLQQAIYYNFELFRIREKQIPVDNLEMKGKIQVVLLSVVSPLSHP